MSEKTPEEFWAEYQEMKKQFEKRRLNINYGDKLINRHARRAPYQRTEPKGDASVQYMKWKDKRDEEKAEGKKDPMDLVLMPAPVPGRMTFPRK